MSSVIKIENLWKEYRLGVIGHGTLTHDLQSWWARVRGKEDPNAKIVPMLAGQEKQIEGDHFWALRDINLDVKEGEIIGIIGKNGAGKSTLLKILSRVTAPTRGNIKENGRIASLLEVGTGFHPELTGRENIFMNGVILGMSKREIRGKLDEIINFSGVEDFIDTPVKRYSSGMYVRLAFAVAAHLDPEILIIDEVLAVGDVDFQRKCLGKMQDVSLAGRTVLIVSHNMAMMNQLCSTAILLQNGTVAIYDDSGSVIKQYIKETVTERKLGAVPKEISTINTGKIFIEHIDMICEKSKSVQHFYLKENFKIILQLTVKENVENVLLDVRFHSMDGIEVAHIMNTYDLNEQTFLSKGKVEVQCTVRNMLQPGNYFLSFGVHLENGATLEYLEKYIKIEVLKVAISKKDDFKFNTRLGYVRMSADWLIKGKNVNFNNNNI